MLNIYDKVLLNIFDNTFDKVWHYGLTYKLKENDIKDKQAAMSFNGLFQKSPTKSSFKWSVPIMDKRECRSSTGINFGTFIVFDLHKRFGKRLTFYSETFC